jgi:6-phosphogluconolactonase
VKDYLYVGSFNASVGGGREGIYVIRVDRDLGQCEVVQAVAAVDPAHLCLSEDGRYLFAVSESEGFDGVYGGAVSSYSRGRDGRLQFVSSRRTYGADTGYVSVGRNGTVFAGNYGEGTTSVMHIDADGQFYEQQTIVETPSFGAHGITDRDAHVHCVVPSPTDSSFFVVDAGRATITLHNLGKLSGRLCIKFPEGSRPRHMTFSADGRNAYLVSETGNLVHTLVYSPHAETPLVVSQTLSTLPADHAEPSYAASIKLSPDQATLAVSNRGHDSIALYTRNTAEGHLAVRTFVRVGTPEDRIGPPRKHMPVVGSFPRDIAYSPSGDHMAVALQRPGRVLILAVDASGNLSPTNLSAAIPNPSCVQFAPLGETDQ